MLSLTFSPLVPMPVLAVACAVAVLAIGYGAWRGARGVWLRAIPIAALLLAIADPKLVNEQRAPLKDIAVVMVDDSRSQDIGERRSRTKQAADALAAQLNALGDIEVRAVTVGRSAAGSGTRLFAPLDGVLSDVPPGRLAGVVLITDGQVHDAPAPDKYSGARAPLHVILSGERGEQDRRIRIERAPDYALAGQQTMIRVAVDDVGGRAFIPVSLVVNGKDVGTLSFAPGETADLPVPIETPGANIVEVKAQIRDGELSARNNVGLVSINGVRDRMRVLLISGEPHVGERAWRNLLKSDPNVDLIHFTILRPLSKDDGTPLNELALIAFPIRELFEEQLMDFDLIIFDRYSRRGLVPDQYMANVAAYVRQGGAAMLAVGPEYADSFSLYDSSLQSILPAAPTGDVFKDPYLPSLSPMGRRHPVTAELSGSSGGRPTWGRWLRQVQVAPTAGESLMNGIGNNPLLMLNRVEKGRIALLMSDTIWLWGKGFDGGGPQAELLRKIAHWLMKEPDLEEEAISAEIRGDDLVVTRRSLTDREVPVTVTDPDGQATVVTPRETSGGRAIATLPAGQPGLYTLSDGTRETVAAVGAPDPLETYDVTATADKLAPVVAATDGGIYWQADSGTPAVRRISPGRTAHGTTWLGLNANREYVVTGVSLISLIPAWLALLAIMAGAMAAWWREGR